MGLTRACRGAEEHTDKAEFVTDEDRLWFLESTDSGVDEVWAELGRSFGPSERSPDESFGRDAVGAMLADPRGRLRRL